MISVFHVDEPNVQPRTSKESADKMATYTALSADEQSRYAPYNSKHFMTPRELLMVLDVARGRRTRDWCMILIAYRHGLRTEEVCGLTLHDVKNGLLSVQRRKGSLKTVQPLCRDRREPLLDEVSALRAWLKERPDDGSDALFTSQKGGALDRTQFFRIFQGIAKTAGLPASKRHPRVLKYSLASHLLAGKTDLTVVTQILGHRSITSTMQYVKAVGRWAVESAPKELPEYGHYEGSATMSASLIAQDGR